MKKNIPLMLFTSLLSIGVIGCNSNQEETPTVPVDVPLKEVTGEEFIRLGKLTKNYPQIYNKIYATRTITSSKGDAGISDKDLYGDLEYFYYGGAWQPFNYTYRETMNGSQNRTMSYYAEMAEQQPEVMEGVKCYVGSYYEATIREEFDRENAEDYNIDDHIIEDITVRFDLRGNLIALIFDTQNVSMEYTTHEEFIAHYTYEYIPILNVDELDVKDMMFSYNQESNSYCFMGNHRNIFPKSVRIPENYDDGIHGEAIVDSIDTFALREQHTIENIYFNKYINDFSVSNLFGGSNSRQRLSLVSIDVDEENQSLYSKEGILYRRGDESHREALMHCPPKKEFTNGELILDEGITAIESSAFAYCGNLNKITLPNSLEVIYYSVFFNCGSLEVSFGNGLKTIYEQAFFGCRLGDHVILPDSCEYIMGSFANCNFKEITLGKNFKYLSMNTFMAPTELERINYNGTSDEFRSIFMHSPGMNMHRSYFPVDTIYCTDGEVNLDEIFNNENNQN